tara:strand:- start:6258 stop:6482 length:225 start_codon:yes stop_codon:yes gene_type:complete
MLKSKKEVRSNIVKHIMVILCSLIMVVINEIAFNGGYIDGFWYMYTASLFAGVSIAFAFIIIKELNAYSKFKSC